MKKELVLLGSMIAMSGALSSCCCKRGADAAYRQNQQNVYATAPRVVNYKDGGTVRGTPGYIQPTSAEGTTLTTAAPVRQQPARRVSPCSQVQPAMTGAVQQPVRYTGPMVIPSPGVIEANMNYSNSGVMYGGYNSGYYYSRRSGCPAGSYGCGHRPSWHWGNCR